MERTKMPNFRNGNKEGFEPGLTWLRVRHSTTELPRSILPLSYRAPFYHWATALHSTTELPRSILPLSYRAPFYHWATALHSTTELPRSILPLSYRAPFYHWATALHSTTELPRSILPLSYRAPFYHWATALHSTTELPRSIPQSVVFDGYRIPSTKYTTYQRLTGGEVGIEVTFTGDMKLTMSKDVFFSNVANKQNFIDMLSHYLQLAERLTKHAEEDADLLIAQTAMQSAATKNTVLVADDTDLVILLCYYADPDGFDLFMQFSTCGTTKKNRIWDIKVTQSELGADICNNILFIHAILVCDTTSRLYGLGKGLSLNRFTSSALFRDKAEQFCKKDATVDDVIDAVEAALVCLYHIRPQTLPPTSAAAIYHNMRVYLQVQQWLVVCNMTKTDWGGWQRTRTSSLLWRYFLQHQTSCSVSSDATAQLTAAQPDAVVASTVWSVPLHAVSAEVSDVPTAPRLI